MLLKDRDELIALKEKHIFKLSHPANPVHHKQKLSNKQEISKMAASQDKSQSNTNYEGWKTLVNPD